MRRDIEEREPERDPALAAALLEAYADPPVPRERLDTLRARLRESAHALAATSVAAPVAAPGGGLWARIRMPHPLGPAARRFAWATPALLAAAVAGIMLLGRGGRPVPPAAPPPIPGVGYGTPEQALTSTASDAEFARTVTDTDNPAALLAIAVGAESAARP